MSNVEPQHLQRKAYVYVRQSTMAQVERNVESRERQYELLDRAVALGWRAGEVVVVDEDQGRSGKSVNGRDGFQGLVAEIGLGQVGIVLGIEVSRLARNNAAWYQLLDLCALTDTLIADSDGVYHPALHNDRLVLGLKGTMSEAELHVLRARLRGGSLHKAAKGELRLPLPAGLEYEESGRVRVSADEAVADAIATVFSYFDQLQSARQVMLRLLEEERKLPRRATSDRQVRWVTPSYKAIHDILTNPVFAGAYAYGRKRTERRVQNGVVSEHQRRAPREEWHVCIEDHHPGYISFERYLANQQRLRANWRPPRGEGGGAAREGRALLGGLIRCGRCGRRMQVGYSGKTLVPNYSCVRGNQLYGSKRCQSVGGRRIERVVLDAVFQALRTGGDRGDTPRDRAGKLRPPGAGALRRARARARADPRRARPPPVRRLRAREPARRPHPGARVGAAARRRPPRRTCRGRRGRQAPGPADRRGDRVVPTSRRRPAQGVRRAYHHRPRAQAAAARDPLRRRRHRRRSHRAAQASCGWLGGRPGHRTHRAVAPDRQSHPLHRPGHDRARSPARRAIPRQADCRDPRPPATRDRRRQPVHRPSRRRASRPSRDPRMPRPSYQRRWRGGHDREGSQGARGFHRHGAPLAARRIHHRRADHPRRALADPADRRTPRSASARYAPDGWLPLAQAAQALDVARQTVLHKVQRGELAAVYVHNGKRKGLRIQVKPEQTGMFENDVREEAQC